MGQTAMANHVLTCYISLVTLWCVGSGYIVLPKPGLRAGGGEVREGAPRREVYRGGKAGGTGARKLSDGEFGGAWSKI